MSGRIVYVPMFVRSLPKGDKPQFVKVSEALIAVDSVKGSFVVSGGEVSVVAQMSRRTWYRRKAEAMGK